MRLIKSRWFSVLSGVFFILQFQGGSASAQGTAFFYQGRLNVGASPASGTYDFAFSLYPTNQSGVAVGPLLTNAAVPVSSGLFTTTLDFGPGLYTGSNYWLQIAVRTNGAATFTNLTPRQPLLPVPYATFANTASNLLGTVSSAQLTGTLPSSAFAGYTSTVILTNSGNVFGGNGAALTSLDASRLATGTVGDARLSTNVALLNATQTFTGASTFTNLYGNRFSGSFFGNGLVGWLVPTGTTVQAAIDTGYLLTNAQRVTVQLPAAPVIGDIVRVSGAGKGGWGILQNTNQSILGNFFGFGNASWQQSSVANANWASIACSSDGMKWVAAANSSSTKVYTSIDSGKTWSVSGSLSAAWQAVASSANGIKLVAARNNNAMYCSTNAGVSWAVNSAPSGNWSSLASSSDGSRLVGVVNGGRIYVSTDSGATWTLQTSAPSTSWFSVASSADGTNLVAVVAGGGIYTNSGSAWGPTGAPVKNWVSVSSSADGSRLAAVETGGGIYTSNNRGASWTQQASAPVYTWAAIAGSADGNRLVAVSQNGGIYCSLDYGATWSAQSGTPGKTWNCVASSSDGGTLAAGVFGGGLYSLQASFQTTTTQGTNGSLSGVQGSAVELQYIGNNQFMPVSSAGILWAN